MKDKKRLIAIIAVIIIMAPIIFFAYKVTIVKQSNAYKELCELSSYYDESGHVKDFDASAYDVSWYQDVVEMSDKEFFYWYYEKFLKQFSELTPEQFVIVRFIEPLCSEEELSDCETDLDKYELMLEYSTEEALKTYNEEHSTSFNSIEEVVYDDFGSRRATFIQHTIVYSEYVSSFVASKGKSTDSTFMYDCARDVLATYFEYTVTDEEIVNAMDAYVEAPPTGINRLIMNHFYKNEWRGFAASNALLNMKVGGRLDEDFGS